MTHEKYLITNCYLDYFANESTKQALIVTVLALIILFNFCFDFISTNLSNEQLPLSHLYCFIFSRYSSASIFPLLNERSTCFLKKMFDFSILHSVLPLFYPILSFDLFLLFNPFILIFHFRYSYYLNLSSPITIYNLLSPQLIIIFPLLLLNYIFSIIPIYSIVTKEF